VRIDGKRFFLTIILPTLLTLGLFVLLIFRFIIPYFAQNMLEQKKAMIREVVSSGISIAATCRQQALAGVISEEEARAAAILQIGNIRYGAGHKDYCWITDMQPRMIRHPYRPDLNGRDLGEFQDAHGKRLFVEMVRAVKPGGAGFVDYMWQWMDDPGRIVPKISYVREFKPWGWVIGTGIYIEDVREEISGIQKRLLLVLMLISAALALLLAFIVRQNLRTEMRRTAAERDLLESREKYKALVDASTEGTWMILNGATIYANKKMEELVPGAGQRTLSDDLREILAADRAEDVRALGAFSRGAETFIRLETVLSTPERPAVEVILSISKIVLSEKRGYIVIVKELRLQDESSAAAELALARSELVSDTHALQLRLQQPVAQVMREPVHLPAAASIRDAAELMSRHGVDALLVRSGEGDAVGIVTDGDLRRRVVAPGRDTRLPVTDIMSSPLHGVPENMPLVRAWDVMGRAGVKHLVLSGQDGRVLGIIARDDFDLSLLQTRPFSRDDGGMDPTLADLRIQFLKLPELLAVFVNSHAHSDWLAGLATAVADRTAAAIAAMVELELGPPPAAYSFFALGSEGRSESTLYTDQDNALVYHDPPAGQLESCRRYFLEFGERMNRLLAQTGYALCPGRVMAGNPAWNRPLSEWEDQVSDWVRQPDPQNLLESTTFFDLRHVHGESSLLGRLRGHGLRILDGHPAFFAHLAGLCLRYKIPLGIFGRIQTDPGDPRGNRLNIKDPLRVMVSLVRLYALAHGIDEANTRLRLRRLLEKGVFSVAFHQDIDVAFDFLIGLQFRGQLRALRAKKPLGHSIGLDELAESEVNAVKAIFSQIHSFQSRLKHDFSVSE
jgi:signal-transduction protein with cAMP-binding, CBS, and nucleotidyltransferase domain